MTSDKFTAEPVIGHHVEAQITRRNDPLSNSLDRLVEDLGIERRYSGERIKIAVSDVDWSGTKALTLSTETFEDLIRWYEGG